MTDRSPPASAPTRPLAPLARRARLTFAVVVAVLLAFVVSLAWAKPPGPHGADGGHPERSPTQAPSAPVSGDAAGADLAALPRFPGSRRVWYRERYAGDLVVLDIGYAAEGSLDAVLAHYRAVFRGGWTYGDVVVTSDRTRYFVIRDEQEAIVDITTEGRMVTVAVVHSRPLSAPPPSVDDSPRPPGSAPPAATPRPEPQPTPHPKPDATRRPTPTPTPTPTRTSRPTPTHTPRPTRTPTPRPTCEADDDGGCDDGNDGDGDGDDEAADGD